MERLPEFNGSNKKIWNDLRILKKALQLSPIEKPDMSPFLVHMTGKDQILKILESSENNDCGVIKAFIPSQSKSSWYDRAVVCFTESVLHSIDSFRYIAFNRFESNLFYGIGFSKEKMAIRHKVKPALYMDKNTIGNLANLDKFIKEIEGELTEENSNLKLILDELIPFITPVFQDIDRQGYTWEREWRYFNSFEKDFEFQYKDIAIICCPVSEKRAIEERLGVHAEKVRFVSTWGDYNEVVDFMKSREHNYFFNEHIDCEESLNRLIVKERELNRAKSQLESYRDYASNLANQISDLEKYIEIHDDSLNKLSEKIEEISKNYTINSYKKDIIKLLKINNYEVLSESAAENDLGEDEVDELLDALETSDYNYMHLTQKEQSFYRKIILPLVEDVSCERHLDEETYCSGNGLLSDEELLSCYQDIDQELICNTCKYDREKYFEDD
ncbi:hypothetical protein [Acinetobacter gyllenbergii]|uniref:hypothetical protein n=1 Tax=Acinetobacter gyllenbergii TaxID=134534 RepID=UPI00241D0A2D|nr:hypothetical protein [Acinetobacter gyllenbergii]